MAEEEAVLEEDQLIDEPEFEEEVDEVVAEEVADEPIDESEEEGEEFTEILLGDESLTSNEEEEDTAAPAWVKDLRKAHRETQKKNRELQQKLEAVQAEPVAQVPTPDQLRKPKLEDFDYESDKFEEALGNYYKDKRKAEEAQARQQEELQKQQAEYQEHLNRYAKAKTELKLKDYDEAEEVAVEMFDDVQQEVIVKYAKNPALAVYAIGKNSTRAKELAAIKDPVKFALAVNELESKLKVNKRKSKPLPEGKVRASGKKAGVDSTLERLEKEAEKTNDRTKIAAYKRQLRAKQRKK